MKKLVLFFALLGGLNIANGQNDWLTFPAQNDSVKPVAAHLHDTLDFTRNDGKVEIVQDERINAISDFVRADEESIEGVKIDGYRVLIFFDPSKTVAQQMKAQFLSLYSEHRAYIDYLAPNYRVRVGNFRTRIEAEALKRELIEIFPTAVVIKDKIQLPELPETITPE